MTIAVGVACPEGLVLATDSRSSILTADKFRIATDPAHKLFELGRGRHVRPRFAVATYGWAYLNGKTIAGHMEDLDAQTTPPESIEEAVDLLKVFFGERLEAHLVAGLDDRPAPGIGVLGFLVAGFDTEGVGHIQEVLLPTTGQVMDECSTAAPGARWRGNVDVLARLMAEYDAFRLNASQPPEDVQSELEALRYLTPFGRFALQDAVDFAAYVVRTTIDTERFTDGVWGDPGSSPTCGGPIEIAVVTAGGGMDWLQRTPLRAYGAGAVHGEDGQTIYAGV